MSFLRCLCKSLGGMGLILAVPAVLHAQSSYVPQGAEYLLPGVLAGDQVHPSLSLNASGGFAVWHDNITDGAGYGVSAQRLNSSLSPAFGVFRVNEQGADDQENARVVLLPNGGAAFVWQGGKQGFQHIYARFLNASNTFVGGDVMVSTSTNNFQIHPVIATLPNGNVIVAWGSFGQDNAAAGQTAMQGVYAQILSPTGQKIGGEFLVNETTLFNQRTPTAAAFPNGNFIIAWVSEKQRVSVAIDGSGLAGPGHDSIDIYARLFNSSGSPIGGEFLVNTSAGPCANPEIAVALDNSFIVAWGEKDGTVINNSWDLFTRQFSAGGIGGTVVRLNTQQYGDQYTAKMASLGTDYLAVWTSLLQDGSREGVFGQVLSGSGAHVGGEFRVNTTLLNAQKFPAVAADGGTRFLVVWSGYTGGLNSMDLNGQRYATYLAPLAAPAPPFVTPVSSSRLTVTWQPIAGFSVSNYSLYVDGSNTPVVTTNILWSMSGLPPSSSHTFTLDYLLTDGRRSPQSAVAGGTTWGADENFDGLPDDWQEQYWGANQANWPSPGTKLNPDGTTVLQVFQWGANPLDQSTWLRPWLSSTPQGMFLFWRTVPGSIYQVETKAALTAPAWSNLGTTYFAAGTTNSVYVGSGGDGSVFRVKLIRY